LSGERANAGESAMLQMKVGLTDETGTIDPEMMAAVAAALNVQVTRDLPQFWPINATISYLPNHRKVPQGVWPVQLVKSLPPGEGGFHTTRHNQPYAKVIATANSDEWTVDASHETIEMLVDPAGNRLQTSTAIAIVDNKIGDSSSNTWSRLATRAKPTLTPIRSPVLRCRTF